MAKRTRGKMTGNRKLSTPVLVGLETLGAIVVAVSIGFVAHATFSDTPVPSPSPSLSPSPSASPSPSPSPSPEPDVSFTLVAGGDVIPHSGVVQSATSSGVIDFGPLWSNIDPWVSGADLALCNMETPVAPLGTQPSSYPLFGAPRELVTSLDEAGWDGCSTATNHAVDRGWSGIVATLDAFDEAGMGAAGTARSSEEAASAQYYRLWAGSKTITVAQVSYTYGTNGLPLPSGKPWSVNVLSRTKVDATPILDAAQEAREAGADVVVTSVHHGNEYQTSPTSAQVSLATQIADSGLVDLYIGHHAHVPQPIVNLPGGPNGDGMWVAYGLGNYISNQDAATLASSIGATKGSHTNSGELLIATFTVDPSGTVTTDVEWAPITVDRRDHHTMHILSEIPNGTGTLSAAEVAARYQRVRDAVGTEASERLIPPESLVDLSYAIRRIPLGSSG